MEVICYPSQAPTYRSRHHRLTISTPPIISLATDVIRITTESQRNNCNVLLMSVYICNNMVFATVSCTFVFFFSFVKLKCDVLRLNSDRAALQEGK